MSKEPQKDVEEYCNTCGKETTWDECHYCNKCDAALCPYCSCACEDEEEPTDRQIEKVNEQ